jgi:hypothetical protein
MDLTVFEEVELGSISQRQQTRMTVFLAYQTPTGVGLYSALGHHLIFRENLNKLFDSYAPYNGEIWRPVAGDALYRAVVDMLTATSPEGVFVRYLAADDVHGLVVWSRRGDRQRVRNYIFKLEYDDEGNFTNTRAIARDFEGTLHPTVAINSAIPNFNFDLLPDYDMARLELVDEGSPVFDEILGVMIENEQIYENGEPVFISSTNLFAYIVFLDHGAFLGLNGPAGWRIIPVDDWRDAGQIMVENVINPPLYILWQN